MNTVVAELREVYRTGRTRPLEWRDAQLAAIASMLSENTAAWENALASDLGKPAIESYLTEVGETLGAIEYLRSHVRDWVATRRVPTPMALQPARSSVRYDPLGVVVVIAPWNYPVQLMLSPVIGAIAAGNCVVLKPSEVSSATEKLFADLVPRYLDTQAIRVVTGDAEVVNGLIDAEPDHVFYTGSTRVGRLIAARCAPLLVPYTLELGGKSPVYVHDDVDLDAVARRLCWGKFMNTGQTCVSPDHVYAKREIASDLVRAVERVIGEFFGPQPRTCPAYGRIITQSSAERLAGLISDTGRVVCGGETDVAERYVAPTVMFPVTEDDAVMQEEIFGPIIPVLEVDGPDEAAERMLTRETPLALYVFANDRNLTETLLDRVPSGGVGINLPVAHLSSQELPFGGLGASGQGRYHGRWSIDTFTHQRAVFDKPLFPDTMRLVYPPVGRRTEKLIRAVLSPGRRLFGRQ